MPNVDAVKILLILLAVTLIAGAIAFIVLEVVPVVSDTGAEAESAFTGQFVTEGGHQYGSMSSWWGTFASVLFGDSGLATIGTVITVVVPAMFLIYIGLAIYKAIS